MNRHQFLNDPDVIGFLDFFSSCLRHLEVDYYSNYPMIRQEHRHFHVVGVVDARNNYAWPAINTLIGPPFLPIYNWPETQGFLQECGAYLRNAINAMNHEATWHAVSRILEWGLNPNAMQNVLNRLHGLFPGHAGIHLSQYLGNIRNALVLDHVNTDNITQALIPYASSGMSKVHSLASDDGMIIFDSRVAAMLGECINEYLRRNAAVNIPLTLRIFREGHHNDHNPNQRTPRPLDNGFNHPIFVRNHRWIECQVRVSWMFEAVLQHNNDIFQGLLMPERMHSLEAACFMMGAYLYPGRFAGRSFNFANC